MVNSSIPKQVLDETFTVNSNRTGNFHTYQLSMPKYRKPTSIMTNLQFTSNKLVHRNLFSWFWWAYVDDQQFTTGTRKVWFACVMVCNFVVWLRQSSSPWLQWTVILVSLGSCRKVENISSSDITIPGKPFFVPWLTSSLELVWNYKRVVSIMEAELDWNLHFIYISLSN